MPKAKTNTTNSNNNTNKVGGDVGCVDNKWMQDIHGCRTNGSLEKPFVHTLYQHQNISGVIWKLLDKIKVSNEEVAQLLTNFNLDTQRSIVIGARNARENLAPVRLKDVRNDDLHNLHVNEFGIIEKQTGSFHLLLLPHSNAVHSSSHLPLQLVCVSFNVHPNTHVCRDGHPNDVRRRLSFI